MGRSQCSKGEGGIYKGPWTEAEDTTLSAYIKAHGEGNWRLLPKCAGTATPTIIPTVLDRSHHKEMQSQSILRIHSHSRVQEIFACNGLGIVH